MAQWGSCLLLVLVLLVSIISVCESAEYFIRPTANTSCPGQPCLTVNQYMKNTGYYMQSNTVLTFLPGKHVLKRPLQMKNVKNVTLKSRTDGSGMYSQLVVKFCSENGSLNHCIYTQSAIEIINVTNVVITDISLEMWTPNVSGVIVEQSTDVHLQLDIRNVQRSNSRAAGVAVNETSCVYMDRLRVSNLYNGIRLEKTSKVNITNSAFDNCQNSGMVIIESDAVDISNTTLSGNIESGMYWESCIDIDLKNINVTNNIQKGLDMFRCEDVRMTMMYMENHFSGMRLIDCSHMRLFAISQDNIFMDSCKNTTMMNISAINNVNGISMYQCENTTMMDISAMNIEYSGIEMMLCKNTTMMNIFTINNQQDGLEISSCENTTMMNISAINNQIYGVYLLSCEDTTMMSISTTYNQHGGITMDNCANTVLADLKASYNKYDGILMQNHFGNILLRNITVNHNENTQISFSSSDNILLEDSTFSDIIPLPTPNIATTPRTVPAVIELNDCTLIMSDCIFIGNNITSVRAIGSMIRTEGQIVFSDNQAFLGAALLFANSSVLVVSETSHVIFQNNHAINYGGAIYIITDEIYGKSMSIQDIIYDLIPSLVTPSTGCFLSLEGSRSETRLIFTNNTAGKGGDAVFGGLVALGYDGDWNCLLSFKNISDMSGQNGLSVISSEPSRVCLCHNGQPDCLTVADPITHTVYPGQTITLPAVVVGQDFGTVSGSVIAQVLQTNTECSIHLEKGQQSTFVENGKCADLNYTLYTSEGENCTAFLILKTNNVEVLQPMNTDDNHKLKHSWTVLNEESNYVILASHLMDETLKIDDSGLFYTHKINNSVLEVLVDNFLKFSPYGPFIDIYDVWTPYVLVFPNEIYNYPMFINISFRSCPLGFSLSRNPPFKCDCTHLLQQMPQVVCDIQHQTISRDGLVWVGTYDNDIVAASKYCPYNYCKSIHTEITLTAQESDNESSNYSTTDFQCNHKHSGVLCGKCQPGFSLALGTNRCLHCSNVYISLLLPFAMAGLLLVLFIRLLNLTISQGTMNELIFYVNVVGANKHLYYSQTSVNPMTLFIAWFNLDIGIETCFFNGLTAYSRTWLQFVFPLYIWAIAGLIIIIAKYSDRVAKVMGNNGVPVLATLFLLSYAKLFNTIVTAMSYTTLYTTQGQKLVWSADGNLDYLGPKHIPLFCVAVAALLFLWFPYTLLLLLGQWLHRLNCRIVTHTLLKLKPFLDAHFAALKDKYRYWFGLLLLVRAANRLISASIPDNTAGIVEFSTAILSILLTFWGQKVYRSNAVGTFGTAFLLNLSIMNVIGMFLKNSDSNVAFTSFTLIAIALAQLLGLLVYKVVKMTACCCACKKEADDDWELYEQAALDREMESDSEVDRESGESGSIESFPTYGI